MRAVNGRSGEVLATDVSVADTLFSRARGLLGRKQLQSGEGLLITPCKGVHTFFMRFPIDVVFLDRDNRVINAIENLRPNRLTGVRLSGAKVLEVAAGTLTTTRVGDEVLFG